MAPAGVLVHRRRPASADPQGGTLAPGGHQRRAGRRGAVARRCLEIPPAAVTSHRDFHRGVARLGGFLARKRDGEPGWQTLRFGFERLFLLMLGAQLASALDPPRCG
ncbi:IS4 family transposase (plasmid) [Azospirillum sp. A29]|uniref:IS4 family transposase n=1 Tax=Azospirillum sp. A29 TaxID=3160606 RepID=UPI0036735658